MAQERKKSTNKNSVSRDIEFWSLNLFWFSIYLKQLEIILTIKMVKTSSY